MKKHSHLYIAFGLVVVLGTLHFIATAFYFYWTLWWFDNLMHFLAGLTGGFIAVWFLFDSGIFYKHPPTVSESVLWALLFLVTVGIVWEIFEYVNGITQLFESYTVDTLADLFFDALGAILAGVIGAKRLLKSF